MLSAVAEGAYATDSLLDRCHNLTSPDAGLAAALVYGCLRYQAQLDYLILFYSRRKPAALDIPVLLALRTAIFQLRYLERIPAHAAVNDAVEFVKRKKRSASGLVNAVLRKVTRDPVNWPDLATEVSCPQWMLDRWMRFFGREQALAIARAALQEPNSYVRIPEGAVEPPAGAGLQVTDVPGCYRVLDGAVVAARLYDIGSQAIIPLLDLRAGQSYLDLCAAPGNKTLQALEARPGLAIACDISFRRIRDVPPVCPRVVVDASEPLPFGRRFERIFIDAPCSGTGTLARNPEIKWRLAPGDLDRFQTRQVLILTEALKHLEPGGKLLYATCSLEGEENEQVVAAALAVHPGRRQTAELRRLPGRDEGDGFYAALLS